MEEILELRQLLESGKTEEALWIVEELEEMGRKGLEVNIGSYARVLLTHLIKQQIEKRTTKSWDTSIRNSVRHINKLNARPKKRGSYFNEEQLKEIVVDSLEEAIDKAALEVEEGKYDYQEIKEMINDVELLSEAMRLLGY